MQFQHKYKYDILYLFLVIINKDIILDKYYANANGYYIKVS